MTLKPGDYIEAGEADYMYGAGVLRLQVDATFGFVTCHNAQWQKVRGTEYGWNGGIVDREREALVRISVPAQRKPRKK